MAELNISKATLSDMENSVGTVTVDTQKLDTATPNQKETPHMNERFTQQLGYYKTIPELRAAIDAKATWTVGKGFEADTETKTILDNVNGWGVDTFDGILRNMMVMAEIGGDSFAEIIKDKETGRLLNLKPLNPETMRIITNDKGILIRYEQTDKQGLKTNFKFRPDEIFHLSLDRIGNEIHGISLIDSVENIILALNEAFDDQKKLMHRNVKPIIFFKIAEDNETKIKEFITKMDKAVAKGENIYIPQGTVEFEVLSVPPNATLNPLPWIRELKSEFWKAVRIPQIIVGGSQEFTEATAKIAYLAFQQNVEESQRDIEEQIWEQLFVRIKLKFPVSLENELLSDQKKDTETGITQPNDTTVNLAQD